MSYSKAPKIIAIFFTPISLLGCATSEFWYEKEAAKPNWIVCADSFDDRLLLQARQSASLRVIETKHIECNKKISKIIAEERKKSEDSYVYLPTYHGKNGWY
jgi:hypothetical protein